MGDNLKEEDLNKVVDIWKQTDWESKFILVYYKDKFLISYARNDYISLLKPYDLDGIDYFDFTPEQVLDHEVPIGIEGYIYIKDSEDNVKLLAKIGRERG